jgi:hypothetical protein
MNPLAIELNEINSKGLIRIYLIMLSDVGKLLFFPKGILTQAQRQRQRPKFNATIGWQLKRGRPCAFPQ